MEDPPEPLPEDYCFDQFEESPTDPPWPLYEPETLVDVMTDPWLMDEPEPDASGGPDE